MRFSDNFLKLKLHFVYFHNNYVNSILLLYFKMPSFINNRYQYYLYKTNIIDL